MKAAIVFLGILLPLAMTFPTGEIGVSHLVPRHIWIDAPGPIPGSLKPNLKVINGRNATAGHHLYQAGLIIDGRGFCGGSLIRADFVLTAAHCVDDAHSTQVVLGFHVIQEALRRQEVLVSKHHIVHPQWNPSILQNDIALVKIPHADLRNPAIDIIRLAPGNMNNLAGAIATLTGWGRVSDKSNEIAHHLQKVQLEVMSNTRCRLNFLGQVIEDQHLCTAGVRDNIAVGACNGDSGGPLVVGGMQVGVVSFGVVRCEAGFPSVFARVSSFRDFIDKSLHHH